MRITQGYTGKTSHLPHTTGSPKDYPWDEGCADTGKDWCYCPCDKMKIKRIYGVGTGGTNTIWLQSTKKVHFADGTKDFCTLLITHPDDLDLKKLKVGQVFKRKEKICREGIDGATGYHFHFSAGKGKYKGNGWVKNSEGKYVLTTTNGAFKPEKLFFVDEDFTEIKSSKGIGFKNLPVFKTGTYKVNTAVLNVRSGAASDKKLKGTLTKGTKITVDKIKGDWGRIGKYRWVNLNYCKRVTK